MVFSGRTILLDTRAQLKRDVRRREFLRSRAAAGRLLFVAIAAGSVVSTPHPAAAQDASEDASSPAPSFAVFDRELRDALFKRDAVALSFLVQLPLVLNHSDGSVTSLNNPRAVQTRFGEAFPPAIRSAVLGSKPADLIHRGSTVGYKAGAVWADLVGNGESERYRVVVVNLPAVSKQLTSGREPSIVFVCDALKHRVVIDSQRKEDLRLRVWVKPRSVTSTPDVEVSEGRAQYYGSTPCTHAIWTFANAKKTYALTELGCTEGLPPDGAIGTLSINAADGPSGESWCF